MSKSSTTQWLRLKRPAMLVQLWAPGRTSPAQPADVKTLHRGGIYRVRADLYAVVTTAGDPAVAETAYRLAQRCVAADAEVAALLFPGEITFAGSEVKAASNPLLADLERRPPGLDSGAIYLSGHATHELESHWSFSKAGLYRAVSGRQFPLFQLGEARADLAPWRNPEVFGRRLKDQLRPQLLASLRRYAREDALLVTGPVGSGKTRAAWLAFASGPRSGQCYWARSWSARSGGPSLALQLLQQFGQAAAAGELNVDDRRLPRVGKTGGWWSGTGADTTHPAERLVDLLGSLPEPAAAEGLLRVVCDDVETTSENDRQLVDALIASDDLGNRFRLTLIARSGSDLPSAWHSLPGVEVPLFDEADSRDFAQELFAGLSVPAPVQEHFVEVARGFPGAIEEGALQLIRRKSLRRLYGSYFFAGESETDFQPSLRLVRHLEAELLRLGSPAPLRILAAVGIAAPVAELASAARDFGETVGAGWEVPYLRAQLVRPTASVWGDAVALGCEAFARSVAATVSAETIPSPQQALGRQVQRLGRRGKAAWQTYRLLAGSPEALPPLLKAARSPASGASREELLEALTHELALRHGDQVEELALLWVLLPLAHRMGRLAQLRPALNRAIEVAESQPDRLMALTALKAAQDQKAGRLQEAEASIQRALQLASGADDRRKALLIVQLGKLLQRQERFPEARRLFQDLLPLLEKSSLSSLAATARFELGEISLREHRLESALEYHQQALAVRRRQGLQRQLAASQTAVGSVLLALGEYQQALGQYRDALDTLPVPGNESEASAALLGLGQALSRLGDYTAASVPFRRALSLRQERDDLGGEAIARLAVANNHLSLGQIELAQEQARKAHFQLRLADAAKQLGDAEQLLGRIALYRRVFDDAANRFQRAIDQHQEHGDLVAATFDRAWLLEAELARHNGDAIERLCRDLEALLATLRYPEGGELLDLRLYRGLDWLRRQAAPESPAPPSAVGSSTAVLPDPLGPLRRAYRELCRKTERLATAERHRFLSQSPDNRAIVQAAGQHGLEHELTEHR